MKSNDISNSFFNYINKILNLSAIELQFLIMVNTVCGAKRVRRGGSMEKKKFKRIAYDEKNVSSVNPLVTINKVSLKGFDERCIIYLNGVSLDDKGHIIYTDVSIGEEFTPYDGKEPLRLRDINSKKFIMVTPFSDLLDIGYFGEKTKSRYYTRSVSKKGRHNGKHDEYVIVLMGSDCIHKGVGEDCMWTLSFYEQFKKNMKVNIRGDGVKHHESVGHYHGVGLTAKYSQQKIAEFAKLKKGKHKLVFFISYLDQLVFSTIYFSS